MSINDEGIEWEKIDIIKDDNAKKRERIDNQLTKLYRGIGIYDTNGNMSQYMKSTMIYLLTYNLDKGTGSLLQSRQAPIPVTISMELDGIGGLQVGNVFRVDYLPETYREFCYFVITKVDHNISTSGWSTSVDGMMMADMPHYWDVHQNQLNEYQQDYNDLFKLTDITLSDFADKLPGLNTLIDSFNTISTRIDDEINAGEAYAENPGFAISSPIVSQDQNIRELKSKLNNDIIPILSLLGEEGKERIETLTKQIEAAENNYEVFLGKIPLDDYKELVLGGGGLVQGVKTTQGAIDLNAETADQAGAQAGVGTEYGTGGKPTQGDSTPKT